MTTESRFSHKVKLALGCTISAVLDVVAILNRDMAVSATARILGWMFARVCAVATFESIRHEACE
jgi:hypothetical protein